MVCEGVVGSDCGGDCDGGGGDGVTVVCLW